MPRLIAAGFPAGWFENPGRYSGGVYTGYACRTRTFEKARWSRGEVKRQSAAGPTKTPETKANHGIGMKSKFSMFDEFMNPTPQALNAIGGSASNEVLSDFGSQTISNSLSTGRLTAWRRVNDWVALWPALGALLFGGLRAINNSQHGVKTTIDADKRMTSQNRFMSS